MNDAELKAQGRGRFSLNGCLSFVTAKQLLRDTAMFVETGKSIVIDLGGVERTDSAGIALLVEWMKKAHRANCTIGFVNVPDQMLAIARTSDLVDLLPIQ